MGKAFSLSFLKSKLEMLFKAVVFAFGFWWAGGGEDGNWLK